MILSNSSFRHLQMLGSLKNARQRANDTGWCRDNWYRGSGSSPGSRDCVEHCTRQHDDAKLPCERWREAGRAVVAFARFSKASA